MLSRVAERMYWIGRYLERAENTARMVSAQTRMLLDSPREVPAPWKVMLQIVGLEEAYDQRYGATEERPVVRYLLAETANASSILSSLANARENARTTREILPIEAWEQINDVYWYAREQAAKAVARTQREPFLNEIIRACQLLYGLLAGNMSHDAAYHFFRLGRHLERADMTTRVLDLGAVGPDDLASETATLTSSRWMRVLSCLSAYQMYHQHVQTRVNPLGVCQYLLKDSKFPHAVAHCMAALETDLAQLPRHPETLAAARALHQTVQSTDVASLLETGLSDYLDTLQVGFNAMHNAIAHAWFITGQTPA